MSNSKYLKTALMAFVLASAIFQTGVASAVCYSVYCGEFEKKLEVCQKGYIGCTIAVDTVSVVGELFCTRLPLNAGTFCGSSVGVMRVAALKACVGGFYDCRRSISVGFFSCQTLCIFGKFKFPVFRN